MGQWKKVIVESSSAHFDQVTAEGGFSGSNLNPLLAFDGNRTISNNLSILSYHEKLLFNVLYYSDGRRISDIQKELKCNKKNLMKVIGLLHKNKLIRKLN